MNNKIINGDCIEELKKLPENSVDAIVTDPPYGLEFMGKEWDSFIQGGGTGWKAGQMADTQSLPDNNSFKKKGFGKLPVYRGMNTQQKLNMQIFFTEWATECLRVLKPGGFLLAFGGTRTYHRLACGIEDAGFEIRDCIQWLYGSGFPKSHNIGKAVDKLQGNERKKVGERPIGFDDSIVYGTGKERIDITKGNSEWEGWGTALKPANEPIVVARKPLSEKNVALNVLKWGTGGINIDGCRVEYANDNDRSGWHKTGADGSKGFQGEDTFKIRPISAEEIQQRTSQGRFPANIILDEEAGRMLDEQSGISSGGKRNNIVVRAENSTSFGGEKGRIMNRKEHNDKGGASRFFYCPKASKSERNKGCEGLEIKEIYPRNNSIEKKELNSTANKRVQNNHPTIKPIKLMQYLVRLVTKNGGIVLDPFLGSGTTAIACVKEGMQYIGIEQNKDYCKIAEARLKPFMAQERLI